MILTKLQNSYLRSGYVRVFFLMLLIFFYFSRHVLGFLSFFIFSNFVAQYVHIMYLNTEWAYDDKSCVLFQKTCLHRNPVLFSPNSARKNSNLFFFKFIKWIPSKSNYHNSFDWKQKYRFCSSCVYIVVQVYSVLHTVHTHIVHWHHKISIRNSKKDKMSHISNVKSYAPCYVII